MLLNDNMDRNTIIGFLLIFGLILAWQQFMQPSPEELAAEQQLQDSLRTEQQLADSLALLQSNTEAVAQFEADTIADDSLNLAQLGGQYGAFAAAAQGAEQRYVLEDDQLRITFSNKGARIVSVQLKDFEKIVVGEQHSETKTELFLLEDEKNQFEFLLPVAGLNNPISTDKLFFSAIQDGKSIVFRADAGQGRYFEQRYALNDHSYELEHQLRFQGLDQVLTGDVMQLNWVNHLDPIEKNTAYERNYSTVYFKPSEKSPDYCSCTSDDVETLDNNPLKWVSHTHQFFNSTLIADDVFQGGEMRTQVYDEGSEDMKRLETQLSIPLAANGDFNMRWYIGPNKFERLRAYDMALEDIIPFGSSIFGTINRWIIRPIFSFLSGFIGSAGLVILILTFVVKLVLYPLSYKMLYSQAKMGAMKPHIAAMKEKFKDDPQKQQMETMKVYQEFGVNPLGGCLPVALQMPIWFALYRFFPASIEFRQESFLWATDLSSYDVAFALSFEIPFYGDHVSLFTLLWAGTTVIYTYYNTREMDMSINPAMKYMQYFMPLMFLFFFNNFAAGLTCYLLFSNILNITQTVVTKGLIINHDKIRDELEAYRKNPKKKGGFQARLQDAMKEQQRIAAEREATKKKNKK